MGRVEDRKRRPRSANEERRVWVCLTDNQETLEYEGPGGWSQSSSSLRPSFVSGHYSRRMEAASPERSSDPREGHNQAKAVLRARPPPPLLLPIATPSHPPSRCNVFCRRVDDPEPHRSATRNTTGDDLFAECVDRHAIIPTIHLRPGDGRQKTCSTTLEPRFFSRRRVDLKRLARIVYGFLSRKNVEWWFERCLFIYIYIIFRSIREWRLRYRETIFGRSW